MLLLVMMVCMSFVFASLAYAFLFAVIQWREERL